MHSPHSAYDHAIGVNTKNSAFLAILFLLLGTLLCLPASAAGDEHPTLAIGSAAPDFCLPGIDGQTHCLKEYAASKILVIAFTCNHCPTAQLYESRIKQIADDYKDKGVAVVAIEPNNPDAVMLDEMAYTDVGDSFEDMKTRAEFRHFNFPYLYDGETQKISTAYGPTATPHLFIFDSERKLRYEGRVDNNMREPLVTSQDARAALDALLAGKPVAVAKTPSVGCSTKWIYKEAVRREEMEDIAKKPVSPQSRERGRSQSAAQELNRQIAARGFLGDVVWSVPRRVAGVRDHVPDVRTPGV